VRVAAVGLGCLMRETQGGGARVANSAIARAGAWRDDEPEHGIEMFSARMTPHKCPVCDGTGLVSRPPWVAGDQLEWSDTSTSPHPCRACGGSGVLWEPSPPPVIQIGDPVPSTLTITTSPN